MFSRPKADARDEAREKVSAPLTDLLNDRWSTRSSTSKAGEPGDGRRDAAEVAAPWRATSHGDALPDSVDLLFDRLALWFPPPVHVKSLWFRLGALAIALVAFRVAWPAIQRDREEHASSSDPRLKARWMAYTLVTVLVIGFVADTGWKEAYHAYCIKSNLQHAGNLYWLKKYMEVVRSAPLI